MEHLVRLSDDDGAEFDIEEYPRLAGCLIAGASVVIGLGTVMILAVLLAWLML